MNELKNGWRTLSEADLKKFDQYPVLVQTILKMGEKDLEELRLELEKTIREWLSASDPSDKAVKIVQEHLQSRGRVVITGEPPLTEMSLTAYSEIIAFSRLLRQNSQASLSQIAPDSVKSIKKQVVNSWRTFSKSQKEGIATSPGLWVCLRTLLREGSKTNQEKIRNQLRKLSVENETNNYKVDAGDQKPPMNMAAHNSLMAMQQMTFNNYMWSRSFNYQPATGKMW